MEQAGSIINPNDVSTGAAHVESSPEVATSVTMNAIHAAPYQTITVSASMTQAELQASAAQVVASPAEAVPAKRTKVAILGFVQHYKLAPFQDPTFEIWGLNELYAMIPRWDRWFELHPRAAYENDRNRVSDHIQKLKAMTCPVYMHKHWEDIPGSVPYPMDAVCQAFPNPCPEARPYLTNSISYMIFLAILEGFQEVHLYGVDMAHDTEYAAQRPSCEWAVGIAQGRGIKVYLPAESDLLKTLFFYGFEQEAAIAFDRKLATRVTEMETQIGNLDKEIERLIEMRAQYRGAHQDTIHWRKNWKPITT